MPFISKGKTNVKYLFILFIVALFAGGAIIACQELSKCPYFWPKVSNETLIKSVGPDSVWQISQNSDAIAELHNCPLDGDSISLSCINSTMEKYGASQQAKDFYAQTGWFLESFEELGQVDVAGIVNPWRANSNFQYALVNGSPSIIYIEGANLSSSTDWQLFTNIFPDYIIWPGGGFVNKTGEDSYLFRFSINDDCHACGTGYYADISFNFADGQYQGSKVEGFCAGQELAGEEEGPSSFPICE